VSWRPTTPAVARASRVGVRAASRGVRKESSWGAGMGGIGGVDGTAEGGGAGGAASDDESLEAGDGLVVALARDVDVPKPVNQNPRNAAASTASQSTVLDRDERCRVLSRRGEHLPGRREAPAPAALLGTTGLALEAAAELAGREDEWLRLETTKERQGTLNPQTRKLDVRSPASPGTT
jgi:hypothetical protein